VLYVACLVNVPYLYPLFEITVLAVIYYYMKYRHESMCRRFADELPAK
jgi:Flp pilus assembly protein TadB